MKKARVHYNEKFDAFDIEIKTEDGWELISEYSCHKSTLHPYSGANYIHFGILRKIADLQHMGYNVKFE